MLCHGKEPIKSACPVFPLGHTLKVDCLPQAARIILSTFSVAVDASGQIMIGLVSLWSSNQSLLSYLLVTRELSML